MRILMRVVPAACLVLVVGVRVVGVPAQDGKAPEKKDAVDEKTIRRLIAELGDDSFDKREAAQKRIAATGEPALELLQKAAKDATDFEMRERLEQLTRAITSKFFTEVRRYPWSGQSNNNWTTRLAVTPDGRKVVAVKKGSLRCWNVADGKEAVTFDWSDVRNSWALAMSPDGSRLIVGSDDGIARVFDMTTGKLITELKGHTSEVYGAALLPGGKRAVTGSTNRSLRVWEVENGRELRAIDVPEDIHCLGVSPDGKLVAVGHTIGYEVPGIIRLWDIESGQVVHTLTGHTKRLCSVQFAPDGESLVSSSFDKTVRLWDVTSGKLLKTLEGHTNRVEAAAFAVDGKRIISVGNQDNPVVVMWDIASGALLYQTGPMGAGLLDVVVLPDGRHCLTCGKDGVVHLWQWKR